MMMMTTPTRATLAGLLACAALALGCDDAGSGDPSLTPVESDTSLDAQGDGGVDATPDTAQDTVWDEGPDTQVADGDAPDAEGDAPVADAAPDGEPSGRIRIYLQGDTTPKTFDDGLSGQTPTDFAIGLSAYEVMTSADDPDPELCFDHGADAVVADLSGDTLVGECATADLSTAVYTWGRVRVEWSRYTVQGTLHYMGGSYPGAITFFRAWSETTYEGKSYAPNTGWIAYDGIIDTEIPWTYPAPQDVAPLEMELVDGAMWMSFPYTQPLFVDASDTGDHWARFHWEIADAFRWADKTQAGYADGTWDLSQTPTDNEEVLLYGVSGYHITASTD